MISPAKQYASHLFFLYLFLFFRYVELNTRFSGGYKRYNLTMPKYLHNKPRPFLNHCEKRMKYASEIQLEHVREEGGGNFKVQSQTNEVWYNLSFGSENVMPRCSCPDFCQTGMLCKHFFAIFNLYPKWQWDSLPERFRQSPHISLDWEHVFVDAHKYKATNKATNESFGELENDSTDENVTRDLQGQITGIPRQKAKKPEDPIRHEAMACREKLKELTSITYNIENLNGLKELNSSLELLVNKFTTYQTTDEKENLPQTLLKKQINKSNGKSSAGPNYLPLPVRPKKNRYKNRVGAFASMMQKHYKVNVPVSGDSGASEKTRTLNNLKRKNKSGLKYSTPRKKQREDWGQPAQNVPTMTSETSSSFEKQYPPGGMRAKNSINAPTQTSNQESAPEKPAVLNKSGDSRKEAKEEYIDCSSGSSPLETNHVHSVIQSSWAKKDITNAPTPAPTDTPKQQSAPEKQAVLDESGKSEKEKREKCHHNSQHEPVVTSSASPVIVINDDSPDPPLWVKLENCNPDDPDSKLILYEASKSSILRKTSWLTDSEIHAGQLLLKKEFPFLDGLNDTSITGSHVVPAQSDFVQIVNTGSHWVCLTSIATGSASGTVRIFDSLYLKPSSIAIEHACRMLMFPGDQVTLVNEKVQRQVGSNDCGLFAMAFATDLCNGLDPVNQRYEQGCMRQHYVSCLENGSMVPFPKTTKKVPLHIGSKKSSVAIYCVCRMPYDKEEYVQCSYRCRAWYHTSCVKIPEWAINSGRRWKCGECRKLQNIKGTK